MELTPDVLKAIKMTEFTALVTIDPDGTPHLVGGWNCLPAGPDRLLLSGERYVRTRANLIRDPRIWLMVASREGSLGYRLAGRAEVSQDPAEAQLIKKYWPRCGFALSITIDSCEDLVFWRPSSLPEVAK